MELNEEKIMYALFIAAIFYLYTELKKLAENLKQIHYSSEQFETLSNKSRRTNEEIETLRNRINTTETEFKVLQKTSFTSTEMLTFFHNEMDKKMETIAKRMDYERKNVEGLIDKIKLSNNNDGRSFGDFLSNVWDTFGNVFKTREAIKQ